MLVLLFTTSCRSEPVDPPYGVWVSEEPRIVLFFKPEYRTPRARGYLGLYTIDDVETKVFARMHYGVRFSINPADAMTEDGVWLIPLFVGDYRMVDDEFHYRLTPMFQERLGIDTIVFHRVYDYDPIDPYYWFPWYYQRTEDTELSTQDD
jgi:hypothetical protein